jgi:hypothetical protein
MLTERIGERIEAEPSRTHHPYARDADAGAHCRSQVSVSPAKHTYSPAEAFWTAAVRRLRSFM